MKWHDDDEFWEKFAPAMFSRQRLEGTAEEIDNLLQLAGIKPPGDVLDLCCGPGRASIELARRGFNVTGVDRTQSYLETARERAGQEGLEIEFIQQDMRDFRRAEAFDLIVNLFTSFGFFDDPADNEKVLSNAYASLKAGGRLVMELMGKEILARKFRERDWRRLDDGSLWLEERKLIHNWSMIENRWILVQGDSVYTKEFNIHVFSAAELERMLIEAGFAAVEVYGSLAGIPYDHEAQRMVAVAVK